MGPAGAWHKKERESESSAGKEGEEKTSGTLLSYTESVIEKKNH